MSERRAIAIIPARLGSTRFPGKVLADATGRPLIRHVAEAAAAAQSIARVVVATDDRSVMSRVHAFGGECLLTSPEHPNGTSRLAEAAATLGLAGDQIVVNVQGDEPELDPALIDAVVAALESGVADVSTVAVPMDPSAAHDPNIVKVVRRPGGSALYFSRAPIPFDRDHEDAPDSRTLRHVGLYAYRARFLGLYRSLTPTPLELTEKLEQLRVLEHGYAIAVAVCPGGTGDPAVGIDTPAQYDAFVARWRARHPELG